MIEKKSSKGNLDRKKTTFLIIGFVIVFALIYSGFELYSSKNAPIKMGELDIVDIIVIDPDMIVTDPPPPSPPAEQPKEIVLREVDNNIKVSLPDNLWPEFEQEGSIPDIIPVPPIDTPSDDPPPFQPFSLDEMPTPEGGFEALYAFLRSNLTYPEAMRKNNISGSVFLEFVIEKDGSVSNVKVVANVHPELDKEAIRVVKMMPKWKPGIQNEKPVRCYYNIPIRFAIN